VRRLRIENARLREAHARRGEAESPRDDAAGGEDSQVAHRLDALQEEADDWRKRYEQASETETLPLWAEAFEELAPLLAFCDRHGFAHHDPDAATLYDFILDELRIPWTAVADEQVVALRASIVPLFRRYEDAQMVRKELARDAAAAGTDLAQDPGVIEATRTSEDIFGKISDELVAIFGEASAFLKHWSR